MNRGQESLRTLVNSACTGTSEYYAYSIIPVILHKKYLFQSLIQLQFRVYCTALHNIVLSLTLYRLTARLSVLQTNTQTWFLYCTIQRHNPIIHSETRARHKPHPTPHTMYHGHQPPHLTKTSPHK